MFFVLRVLGDEECQVLVDTTLLKELLKLLLKAEVECLELVQNIHSAQRSRDDSGKQTYLRADVESAALPVRLSGQVRRELGVVVERYVLNNEPTLLAHRVDAQRARDRRLRVV